MCGLNPSEHVWPSRESADGMMMADFQPAHGVCGGTSSDGRTPARRAKSWKLSHQTFLPVFRSSSFSTVAVVVPSLVQMTQRLPMAVLAKAFFLGQTVWWSVLVER